VIDRRELRSSKALEPYFSKRVITSSLYYRMVIYMEDSNATISEVLANLQSIFSALSPWARPSNLATKSPSHLPVQLWNGRCGAVAAVKTNERRPSGLDSLEQIGPVAVIILEKGRAGSRWHTYSRVQGKQARRSACRTYAPFVEYGRVTDRRRTKLSAEKKEKLMNI